MKTKSIFLVVLILVFVGLISGQQEKMKLVLDKPAPIFVLRNLSGEDVFLRDFCGNLRQPWKNKTKHVVVLSFFTTYCQPCLNEIPILEQLQTENSHQDLQIFLINLNEKKDKVQKYIDEKGFKLPVLLDRYGVIAKKYHVESVPRIFVISKDGILIWKTTGYSPNLRDELSRVLKKNQTG